MKTIATALFFICLASTLRAQDLSGKWEGKLEVNGTALRLVFHVVKEGTGYTSTMDSPDQNAKDIPVPATTVKDKEVKFDLPAIGGAYEGTLSDNITLLGNWKQAGQTFPMKLIKAM